MHRDPETLSSNFLIPTSCSGLDYRLHGFPKWFLPLQFLIPSPVLNLTDESFTLELKREHGHMLGSQATAKSVSAPSSPAPLLGARGLLLPQPHLCCRLQPCLLSSIFCMGAREAPPTKQRVAFTVPQEVLRPQAWRRWAARACTQSGLCLPLPPASSPS